MCLIYLTGQHGPRVCRGTTACYSHTIMLVVKDITEAIITTPSLPLKFSQDIANDVLGDVDSKISQGV